MMPGSFFFDQNNVSVQPNIFQLTQTPSTSGLLQAPNPAPASEDADTSRKRSRHGSDYADRTRSDSVHLDKADSQPETPGVLSPAPFVNTRYTLAGGLDTPTTTFTFSTEYAMSPDLAMRRGRGWHADNGLSPGSYFPLLARERNGRARRYRPTQSDSWSKTIYNVFGVAEKVWAICKANPFRGFYAGAGPGYQMQALRDDKTSWQSYNEKDSALQRRERETSVPGGFPDEDFIPDYMSRDHTVGDRPTKRLQTVKGGDLSASWVMIDNSQCSREPSPTRKTTRKVPSKASPGRKPVSKAGQRQILPASKPSLTSFAGSPALRSNCPASFAPSRSPLSSTKHGSSKSANVQRYAARIRQRELQEDAKLRRVNQQLKAMIKEGKQALGTKFEIEDGFDNAVDEGDGEGESVD